LKSARRILKRVVTRLLFFLLLFLFETAIMGVLIDQELACHESICLILVLILLFVCVCKESKP
jgi:ABC-type multidrug transport system permease subunit